MYITLCDACARHTNNPVLLQIRANFLPEVQITIFAGDWVAVGSQTHASQQISHAQDFPAIATAEEDKQTPRKSNKKMM